MGESPSFPGQLRADLTASQWVTVTATGLALAAFLLVSLDRSPLPVSASFDAEFLLSLSLLDMAFAYDDYWPVEYGPVYAVLWTFLFGAGTTVVFWVSTNSDCRRLEIRPRVSRRFCWRLVCSSGARFCTLAPVDDGRATG